MLAGLQAVQVLVTGLILGVPLTPVLAIWAGIWTLVPQVGGAIGGLPFILLAFSHSATSGLIAGAAFGLYLVIANNVLLPVIVGKAVDVSPLATMAATIAGFTLLGVIGAILAVPVFGATKSIYKQLRPSDPDAGGDAKHPRQHHRTGRMRTTMQQVRDRRRRRHRVRTDARVTRSRPGTSAAKRPVASSPGRGSTPCTAPARSRGSSRTRSRLASVERCWVDARAASKGVIVDAAMCCDSAPAQHEESHARNVSALRGHTGSAADRAPGP